MVVLEVSCLLPTLVVVAVLVLLALGATRLVQRAGRLVLTAASLVVSGRHRLQTHPLMAVVVDRARMLPRSILHSLPRSGVRAVARVD